jgi:two-component system LytT family sensor kinase
MINKTLILRHFLGWLIYISYELSFIEITVGLSSSVIRYAVFYILNICLFYFNAHVILDFAFFKTTRPYLVASCLILLEIFGYLYLKLLLEAFISGSGHVEIIFDRPHHQLWITNIWREIFYIAFSTAYWSTLYMVRFKERNHIIEKEKLKAVAQSLELENKYIIAENAYLQNQISPHLLFNSLNFIYNSVYKLSEKAGKGVMLLAQVMRYSLVSSEDNRTVPVTQEMEQIDKLIELSHLRFGEGLFVNLRKKGALKDVQILPLVLITLVENMIKHGDLGEPDRPARIRLERNEGTLHFFTQNKKRSNYTPVKGGIGLRNIERRLTNFYQDRFSLEVLESETEFTVTLILYL